MKIEIELSEKNEGTDSPYWIIIDPSLIHQRLEGTAKHGEVPDRDYIVGLIASSIEGPYFSREEAENYLRQRHYEYSRDTTVWCASGYWSRKYKDAIRESRNREMSEVKGDI